VANITASRISLQEMRKMRIFQPAAYISLDLGLKSFTIVRLEADDPSSSQGPKFMAENETIDSGDALEMELRSFVEAVRTRSKPVVCGQEAKKALSLAFMIKQEMENNFRSVSNAPVSPDLLKELEALSYLREPQ
jgi:hypothetical protein